MSRDSKVTEAYDIDELWPDEAEIGAMLRTHFRQHPSDLVMMRHLGELEQVAASQSAPSSHAAKRLLLGAGVAAALLLAVLTGPGQNLGKTEAVGDNPVGQTDPLPSASSSVDRAGDPLSAGTLPAATPTSERGSIGPRPSSTTTGAGSAGDRSAGDRSGDRTAQPRATAATPTTSGPPPTNPTTTTGADQAAPVDPTPTFTLPTTGTAPPDSAAPTDGPGEAPATTVPEPTTTTTTTPPPPTTTCVNLDLLGLIRSCNGQPPSLFDLIGGLLPF